MDKKKITRRAAMGAAIGTIAASPFISRALKARYGVPLGSGTGPMKLTTKYKGKDITVYVPRKIPHTPQERKELEEQIVVQLKKNPIYIESEIQNRDKLRDDRRKKAIAGYDELEKRRLAVLAKQPLPKEEKEAVAKAIKEHIRAAKARSLEHINKLARDDIKRLSKR